MLSTVDGDSYAEQLQDHKQTTQHDQQAISRKEQRHQQQKQAQQQVQQILGELHGRTRATTASQTADFRRSQPKLF
jgi:hypothetical protein